MKFCPKHWQALRDAISAQGLSSLVAESGEAAMRNTVDELEHGSRLDNFDPLMAAHNAIWNNAMTFVEQRYNQSPLIMMNDAAEHPELACPICCLNFCHAEHDRVCTREGCNYPKGETYEWMIERAATDMADEWRTLRP